MKRERFEELLHIALTVEKGGVEIYETALKAVVNDDLKEEYEKYLDQTKDHVRILTSVFEVFGLDTARAVPAAEIVKVKAEGLIESIDSAIKAGDPVAAELVAVEAVVEAETKDHLDWELLGECVKELPANEAKVLKEAVDECEDQEDEHVYHSKGWARELWLQALGLPAVLPPPEEKKHVTSAIGAARAAAGRSRMIPRGRRPTGGKAKAKSKR